MFFNLEEGSIKKGFDGIFTKNESKYIVESKSGTSESDDISHKTKLKLAYNDLKKYFSGSSSKGSNNPWRNAYNHASHADVETSKTIREKIKTLSELYDKRNYKSISEFNIIPCSTICSAMGNSKDFSSSIRADYKFIKKFEGTSIRAICITKHTFDSFIEYLGR